MKILDRDRLAEVTFLETGWHPDGDAFCFAEAIAFVAGEPPTDTPECACLVLASYGSSLNEMMPDEPRQRLIPYVPRLIGTRSDGHQRRRALVLADAAVRIIAPLALRAAGLVEAAGGLERLSPLDARDAASRASTVARNAQEAAMVAVTGTGRASAFAFTTDTPWTLRASETTDPSTICRAAAESAGSAAKSAWRASMIPLWSESVGFTAARAAVYAAATVELAGGNVAEVWDRALNALDAALAAEQG